MMKDYRNLDFIEPKRGVWKSTSDTVMLGLCFDEDSKKRRPEGKKALEWRQAALFAYGRSLIDADPSVRFAMVPEERDSLDAIVRFGDDPSGHRYEGVQLKEVVPEEVRAVHKVEDILEKAKMKYCSGEVLTIAININRDTVTDFARLKDPELEGVSFWFYGLCGRNKGFIIRNPFSEYNVHQFDIEKPPSSILDW